MATQSIARPRPDASAVRDAARGRWLEILPALAPVLGEACARVGRHVSCSVHGGRDGFRLFDDAADRGGGICNTCGPKADGFALLEWANGWSFPEARAAVAAFLGLDGPITPAARQAAARRRQEIAAEEAVRQAMRGAEAALASRYQAVNAALAAGGWERVMAGDPDADDLARLAHKLPFWEFVLDRCLAGDFAPFEVAAGEVARHENR